MKNYKKLISSIVVFFLGMGFSLNTYAKIGSCNDPILLGTTISETGPFFALADRWRKMTEVFAKEINKSGGLSASVWTNDGNRSLRIARALRNGTVWINDHNKLFAEAETGGYRKSGLGRLHGFDALIDFTEIKTIYQNAGVVLVNIYWKE